MNNGVNIKVLSQSQKDAGVSSSLPLRQTMMPLPKMDSRQYSGLPIPKVQYQLTARGQPAYFSSSASSGPADVIMHEREIPFSSSQLIFTQAKNEDIFFIPKGQMGMKNHALLLLDWSTSKEM
ncbi:hypothetical protein XENOCAPTIV_012524 [Xenoophorus captivus]|uniref:Uncharacterized protein n=1 Tax=Xenoophorus captivus TaxID=1517983 RepID=A0ABV0S168_9TELE